VFSLHIVWFWRILCGPSMIVSADPTTLGVQQMQQDLTNLFQNGPFFWKLLLHESIPFLGQTTTAISHWRDWYKSEAFQILENGPKKSDFGFFGFSGSWRIAAFSEQGEIRGRGVLILVQNSSNSGSGGFGFLGSWRVAAFLEQGKTGVFGIGVDSYLQAHVANQRKTPWVLFFLCFRFCQRSGLVPFTMDQEDQDLTKLFQNGPFFWKLFIAWIGTFLGQSNNGDFTFGEIGTNRRHSKFWKTAQKNRILAFWIFGVVANRRLFRTRQKQGVLFFQKRLYTTIKTLTLTLTQVVTWSPFLTKLFQNRPFFRKAFVVQIGTFMRTRHNGRFLVG
jgi:hypothetical protein